MRFWLRERFKLRTGIFSFLNLQQQTYQKTGAQPKPGWILALTPFLVAAAFLLAAVFSSLTLQSASPLPWTAVVRAEEVGEAAKAELQEEKNPVQEEEIEEEETEKENEQEKKDEEEKEEKEEDKFVSDNKYNDQGPSLAAVLADIAETSPRLRSESSRVRELEREIAEIEARTFWQLNLRGSYLRGSQEVPALFDANIIEDILRDIDFDFDSELNSDFENDHNNDLGNGLNSDSNSNLSNDSNSNLSDDLISNLSNDSNSNLSDDLISNLSNDLNNDSNSNLNSDFANNFATDSNGDEISDNNNDSSGDFFSDSDWLESFETSERESFQELRLGLEGSRNFLFGPGVTGRLEYRDSDPVDLDNLSDNLELTLGANYQLWPRVPNEPSRALISLEENLELARQELRLARENLYLELLEDYLEIAFLQEELNLTREQLAAAEKELARARERQQLEEAGELEVRERELAVRRAESGVLSLKELLESRQAAFQQKLGTEEPIYRLDSPLLKYLADIDFAHPEYSPREKLKLRLETAAEYQQLKQSLVREARELDWWQQEQQPEISLSGSREIRSGNWQAGIEFNHSLYAGGLNRLEAERFQERITELEKDQAELTSALEQEITVSRQELSRLTRAGEEARLELEIAELNLEKQQLSFEKGAIDEQEMENSRREVRERRLNLEERSFEQILAALALDSSLGISWIEEGIADVKN